MQFYISVGLIFLVSYIAGIVPLLYKKINETGMFLIPLASGLLIGTSVFQLLPEAIEIVGKSTGIAIFIGFLLVYLPQKFIAMDAHDIEPDQLKKLGMIVFIGIGLHSLTDGIGVGAAQSGGVLSHVSLAITTHKVPDALALSMILIATGYSRWRLVALIGIFAMTTPIGALLTRMTLEVHDLAWAGYSMAFSAGNFLAIAFGEAFKKAGEKNELNRWVKMLLLGAGCLVSLVNFHSH